ncbi:hypothetical protein [Halocatena marina]|uniref:hypothetical protein n=1 Tax=Halocatena marina TaxID=2934937 RepID=UPI003F634EB2
MKYLRLMLRYAPVAQHPMHQFMTESDAIDRELLVAWNLTAEKDVTYALFYVVGERDQYENALEAVETNEGYDLTPVHEGAFYAYLRERDTDRFRRFRAAFEQPSLMVIPPLDYRSNGMLVFDAVGEPTALEAVLDNLPEGITAEVREVGEYDARPGTFAATHRAPARGAGCGARCRVLRGATRRQRRRSRRSTGVCAKHRLESSPKSRETVNRAYVWVTAYSHPLSVGHHISPDTPESIDKSLRRYARW